jgi:hypothetical protein
VGFEARLPLQLHESSIVQLISLFVLMVLTPNEKEITIKKNIFP